MKFLVISIALLGANAFSQPSNEANDQTTQVASKNQKNTDDDVSDGVDRSYDRDSPPAVAIVVPLGAFLLAFSIVAIALHSGLRKDKQRHETLRLMIEKGATIPPELLVTPKKPNSDLRGGLGLVSIGAGVMIMLATMPGTSHYWTGGLVPFALGLARLVYWIFERRQNRAANATY